MIECSQFAWTQVLGRGSNVGTWIGMCGRSPRVVGNGTSQSGELRIREWRGLRAPGRCYRGWGGLGSPTRRD